MHWLEKACAENPLLIARDDPHWSDADSLELLAYVCRRIETLPVCVLGTLRPEPDRAGGFVDDLAATTGAQRISLGPLSSGDGSDNRPRPALTL